MHCIARGHTLFQGRLLELIRMCTMYIGGDTFFDNVPRMVMGSSTFSNADIVTIKFNV